MAFLVQAGNEGRESLIKYTNKTFVRVLDFFLWYCLWHEETRGPNRSTKGATVQWRETHDVGLGVFLA